MMLLLAATLLPGCSDPQVDSMGCWTNDAQIWRAVWDAECETLVTCGYEVEGVTWDSVGACQTYYRTLTPQSCLAGCYVERCFQDLDYVEEACADGKDSAAGPETIPYGCDIVLSPWQVETTCD